VIVYIYLSINDITSVVYYLSSVTMQRKLISPGRHTKFFKHPMTAQEVASLASSDTSTVIVQNRVPTVVGGTAMAKNVIWLLFPKPGERVGHYIATLDRGRYLSVFDPYGAQVGLGLPLIESLLPPDFLARYPASNELCPDNYEGAPNPTINTCGEWALKRTELGNLSDDAFYKKVGHLNQVTIADEAKEMLSHRAHTEATQKGGLIQRQKVAAQLMEQEEVPNDAPEASNPDVSPDLTDTAATSGFSAFFTNLR